MGNLLLPGSPADGRAASPFLRNETKTVGL